MSQVLNSSHSRIKIEVVTVGQEPYKSPQVNTSKKMQNKNSVDTNYDVLHELVTEF